MHQTKTGHTVTCIFENGHAAQLSIRPSETVYQAALRAGLSLETDCREGGCGVCKATLCSGQGDLGDFSDEALSDQEVEEGFILTCQFRPASDVVIQFPYDAEQREKAAVTGRLQTVERAAEDVMRLVIRPEEGFPPFLPGQYANIAGPGMAGTRSYSFANAPGQAEELEFFVRLLPRGEMSDYLRERARPGDAIQLFGPLGQFFLRPPVRPVLMVAGGTGLAPMLSMVRQIAQSIDAPPPGTLLYGANRPEELFAEEELAAFGDWLTVHRIVKEAPAGDWTGPCGFVTDFLEAEILSVARESDAYLCGPPAMIDEARRRLTAAGVPAKRIHAEKFVAAVSKP
ncbi:2Fe-2S iron-sulfur cluster binding domain-containing protein [Telmatospirillum sp. J64-1]|uniref:2Fe-2S iron-sulfur cluster binding domain-containing protein n=1 Tax=Telmatospirillum sp. J64-1 TaxID=2502183 RepID=UPI00115E94F9|nr:2Fe-2S iron-sulfur cluster binding domain-containing protein [Telmatospirillum sp. J64-1]